MHKIKFSRCPIGEYKGRRWEKLDRIDVSRPIELQRVVCMWGREFWRPWTKDMNGEYTGNVKDDTFHDFTFHEWCELLRFFYKTDKVFGMVLYFAQDGKIITTFRAYDVRKAAYYERCVGEEFMVEEVE